MAGRVPLESKLQMSLDDVIEKSPGSPGMSGKAQQGKSRKQGSGEKKDIAIKKEEEDEPPQFPPSFQKALKKEKMEVSKASKALTKAQAKGGSKGAKKKIARMALSTIQRIPGKGKGKQGKPSGQTRQNLYKRVIRNPIFLKRRQLPVYSKGQGKNRPQLVMSRARVKGSQRQPMQGKGVVTYVSPVSWGKGGAKGATKGWQKGKKGGGIAVTKGKGGWQGKGGGNRDMQGKGVIKQFVKRPRQWQDIDRSERALGQRSSKGRGKDVDRWEVGSGKSGGRRSSKGGGKDQGWKGKGNGQTFSNRVTENGKGGGSNSQGGKGSKKTRGNAGKGKASRFEQTKFTESDRNMMKKITIVAQLDKIPNPPKQMTGMSINKSSGSSGKSSSGPLSSRFGANFDR